MRWLRILRIFQVMSAVSAWFEKAMADGVIDSDEAGELVTTIGKLLGFNVKLKLDGPVE
ncbi:hypothetical protein ES705_11638 [subsurface metagenome]